MELKYDNTKFPETDPKLVDVVNRLYAELKAKRVSAVVPSSNPITPKVIWMVQSFIQLTIHRAVDLFEALSVSWESSKPSVAFVLARAIIENAATIFDLQDQIEKHTKLGEFTEIHEAVQVRLMGGRDKESPILVPNILNAIDKADKKYKTFREHYELMSEFAHPNYSGMHGLYGKIDRERLTFHIKGESGINDITLSFLLYSLSVSLFVIRDSIHNLESLYPAIWYLSDLDGSNS
jgi:hypothetical protein